jgi:hypothetical protein
MSPKSHCSEVLRLQNQMKSRLAELRLQSQTMSCWVHHFRQTYRV